MLYYSRLDSILILEISKPSDDPLLYLHILTCIYGLLVVAQQPQGCLSRPYDFKFFKGSPPQISLDPFLNTLSHIINFFYMYNDKKKR